MGKNKKTIKKISASIPYNIEIAKKECRKEYDLLGEGACMQYYLGKHVKDLYSRVEADLLRQLADLIEFRTMATEDGEILECYIKVVSNKQLS